MFGALEAVTASHGQINAATQCIPVGKGRGWVVSHKVDGTLPGII